ncbi:hypothetical protein [Nonomuraea indica]|uniref:hypothetical protein n=1 Tax=Nonomuraea indica TaxID=1581193 RepID=UPI000C7E132B|nr:hypothetical protein [Nonomuraea indica]
MSDTKPQTFAAADRCWIRPNDVTDERHYPTRQAALAPDDPNDTAWGVPAVRQLDQSCLIVVCSCCGHGCDDPGECVVYHSKSLTEAEEAAVEAGWVRKARGWVCRPCSAGDCGWHVRVDKKRQEVAVHA